MDKFRNFLRAQKAEPLRLFYYGVGFLVGYAAKTLIEEIREQE